jgi:predicted HTH transcriptional regulator
VILCTAVIFLQSPITGQHVRDVCARFNEGLRVEYKSTFDANVTDELPKLVSSFANSQGGVLIVGIRAVNGVPQPPFEGFAPPPREEFPLTVENICLQNIHPPVFPRTRVVQSDVPNQVFVVIEVDESGEAPHAIENSKRVYIRTGSAANPYDLAEVDLIIDLMKRRQEPLEKRDRLLTAPPSSLSPSGTISTSI